MLLAKSKLSSIKVWISNAIIDFYINHEEFISANNLLWKYSEMKEEIKNSEIFVEYTI